MKTFWALVLLSHLFGCSLQSAHASIECKICFEQCQHDDFVNWCDGNHWACRNCMLTHVETQIRDGHKWIACPFAEKSKTYSSHNDTHLLIEEQYIDSLSQDVAIILCATDQRLKAIKTGYVPCSTPQCEGMIEEGIEGTRCEVCHKRFVRQTYPAGTRHCKVCFGPLQKDEGCRWIKCGFCLNRNDWDECPAAKMEEKTALCSCVLL